MIRIPRWNPILATQYFLFCLSSTSSRESDRRFLPSGFFPWISFPLGPWYSVLAILNFIQKLAEIFDTSDNWEKFLVRNFLHILLRCCWVAVYTHIMIFYLMFILRCRQADPASVSSLVSWHRWWIITSVVVTGDTLSLVLKRVNVLLGLNAVTAQVRLAKCHKRISDFLYLSREIYIQLTWRIFPPSATVSLLPAILLESWNQ